MKQPIEVDDIRKRDKIRWECTTAVIGDIVAAEYVAIHAGNMWATRGHHYLLDRPAAGVVLPAVPTLGWAMWGLRNYLAVWRRDDMDMRAVDSSGETFGDTAHVTAFTPATAVPTAALTELRRLRLPADTEVDGEVQEVTLDCGLYHFFRAVDEANGDA